MNNSTMVYLAVDRDGSETMFENAPIRRGGYTKDLLYKESYWGSAPDCIELPPGTIKKLTGKTLTWDDGYVTYVSDDYEPE